MTKRLTAEQIDHYGGQGYLFPLDVMPEEQALDYARCLEEAEARFPQALNPYRRNNAHLAFKFLDEIVHHPRMLDAVEDVIGENILVWGTVLFIKEPRDPGFVSWHQDYTYMGLEPHDGVTAWLALTPSNQASGCVKVIPGSHKNGIRPHRDTFTEHNVLSRGQTIDDIDAAAAVDMVLRPGQMSLHHPRTIHGSQPNRSDSRRIGVAVQTYLPPTSVGANLEAAPC